MTRIKICGIKNEEQALAAARAGADFIGLVFAFSHRRITPYTAAKIVAGLKNGKSATEVVGVFVNTHAGTVNRIAGMCGLDRVQLSGDEPWEYCRDIEKPIVKVIHISPDSDSGQICKNLDYGLKLLNKQKIIFLLDAKADDRYGGTGQTFEWKIAQSIARQFPVIIAGGLTPDNVTQVIKQVSPWGVDVSTGVETRGIKDMEKIRKFIEAVRRIDAQTG